MFGWSLSQGLMFGAYIVLARLVSPTDFGRYAAASIVTGVGGLFAESGMMSALISRRDRIDEAASTAFFSLLVSGVLLTLGALAVAPLIGLFFHNDQVGLLSAALSGWLLLRALTVVPDALLQRHFSFARRVAVDPLGAIAFAAASITLGAAGAGAWALVAGAYASMAVQVVSSWAFARTRPRLRLASVAMWRELSKFARPVIGSEILRRIAGQLDAIMLGRFSGAASLGQYRNGLRLAQQPSNAFVDVGAYVLLPTLARLAHDRKRLETAARHVYGVVAAATLPAGLASIPLGVPIAVLFLGAQWRPAGHAIAGLSGVLIGVAIVSVTSEVLKAINRPGLLVRIHGFSLASTALFVIAAAIPFGLIGVAIAVSLSQCITALFAFRLVSPLVDMSWRDLGAEFAWPAVATAAMLLAMFAFAAAADPLGHREFVALVLTACEALVGGAVYLALVVALDRRRREDLRRILAARRARHASVPA
jgi:PST family polysaccharide transporter